MKYLGVTVCVILSIIAGVTAIDYRNETVECVFREYGKCYQSIATLGTNFSAFFDQTQDQMNSTCKNKVGVNMCLKNINCYSISTSTARIAERITTFIQKLCTNKTEERSDFLNSSVCYNVNQKRRASCVKKYGAGDKATDAKSLCCSNLKVQDCLRDEMSRVCPRNDTAFQNNLMEIYRGNHYLVCGPYIKYCNTATSLLSAASIVFTATFALFLQLY